jgi:hypothetical protein
VGIVFFSNLALRRRDLCAGIALSLALIKPHLVLGYLTAVLVISIKERRLNLIAGLLVGLGIQSMASTALRPAVWLEWLNHLSEYRNLITLNSHPTIPQLATYLSGNSAYLYITFIALLIAIAIYAAIKTIDPKFLVLELPILSVAVSPFAWSHDYLILLPAYLMAVFILRSKFSLMAVFTLLAAICIFNFAIFTPSTHMLHLWFPIILWIFIYRHSNSRRPLSESY